jgi:glycosyltransferase involved in cell wall biosynthesis
MENLPLVSAIIPVHNGERYLAEAIESVLSQLDPCLELIVVDDGSTDGSAGVARSFGSRVCYTFQAPAGAGAARNRGVALSRGELLAFLDADDVWAPHKLTQQRAALAAVAERDIVTGQVKQFHSPELDASITSKTHCPTEVMPGYLFGAMLIKRSVCTRVGAIATRWQKGECIDWCSRANELNVRIDVLPEIVLWRRLHQTNMGLCNRPANTDYAQVVKAALDRRRAASILKRA